MIVNKKLTLTMTDLDHILGLMELQKNIPPSLMFLESLMTELELNGIEDAEIDIIELNLE